MPKNTKTSTFGVSRREGHDSSSFYQRSMFGESSAPNTASPGNQEQLAALGDWANQIYCQSAEQIPLPEASVALAFTSPPYNVGKDYDNDLSLDAYLGFIQRVGAEVYRVLQPGGRYVINIANVGRKPYIPLHVYFYQAHMALGFLPMGEIIWQKGKGANASCAWGSWKSAKAPRLRDLHEYLLVFAKGSFSRPVKGESDISGEEFMESTLSVWQVKPASARKVGHPAPFPVELAERVIKLYSFVGDVVLDPFAGSGTTCVAARLHQRHYVGVEISPAYCALAKNRLDSLDAQGNPKPESPVHPPTPATGKGN